MNEQVPIKNPQLPHYWFFALFITISELVFACWNAGAGIILHLILFWALMSHLFLLWALMLISYTIFDNNVPRLYLSLTLIPLMRIISVAVPMSNLSPILWHLLISVPLFLAAFSVARLAGYDRNDLGLTLDNLSVQLLIAWVGIPLGFVGYLVLKELSFNISFALQDLWYSTIILIICTGFLEELLFRGIIYRAALEAMGGRNALLFVSFINATMHISNLSFLHVIYVFLVAVLFTKIYDLQGSIVGISLAHGLLNITLFLICPLGFLS